MLNMPKYESTIFSIYRYRNQYSKKIFLKFLEKKTYFSYFLR